MVPLALLLPALLVGLITLLIFRGGKRPKNFPPGPPTLPLIGNMLQLAEPRHVKFGELAKMYGDLFSVKAGSRWFVVLNNYKDIKTIFNNNKAAGRPVSESINSRLYGKPRGIIFNLGSDWVNERRFCLKTLRDFGFGKKSIESTVMEEVNELIATFRRSAGEPITTQSKFNIAVLNALWSMLTGERFRQDDERLISLIRSLTSVITKRPLSRVLAEMFPIFHKLKKIFPQYFDAGFEDFQVSAHAMIRDIITQHRGTLQRDAPRDFIDCYLIEMSKKDSVELAEEEVDNNLIIVLFDLFIAGAETTSTTLSWIFLCMAKFQEKQDKLFEEIKKVTGLTRPVSLADKPELLYLEATYMEVLRFSSLVPLGVPHAVLENIEHNGFVLPKGTIVISNLANAAQDVEAWGDPENFRPERFLSPDGKQLLRHEAWIPFSTGKRVCLGESLAKDELFLFTGNLLQQFKITNGGGEINFDVYEISSVLVPKPHELILIERSGK